MADQILKEAVRPMSGSRITSQRVCLHMNHRRHHPQTFAAAKSGMSERTAPRVEHEAGPPSQQPRRYRRSPRSRSRGLALLP